jgi:predicted transglutaminase-like cysteine proteinase
MSRFRFGLLYAPLLLTVLITIPSQPTDSAMPRAFSPSGPVEPVPAAPLSGGKLLPAGFRHFPQWDRVRRFILDQRNFRCVELRQWVAWAATLRGRPARERLAAINARVQSRIAYASDEIVWGRPNYWENPREIVGKGATDCEGFAVFKMFLAVAAGLDRDDMAIVVGRVPSRSLYHAVLVVRADGEDYVLDSRRRDLSEAADLLDFAPLYAVNTVNAWSYPAPEAPIEARAVALP